MGKFVSGYLLITLLLLSIFLTGCHKDDVAVVTEVVPAATTETTAVTEIELTGLLDEFALILTPNITRERVSDTRENLLRDGEVIGGIVVLDIDEETASDYNSLVEYVQATVVEGIAPEEYNASMGGGSKYAFWEFDCSTRDREFDHYIYKGNSAFYDVWFENIMLNTWEKQIMTASVRSEDIPYSGDSALSPDQVTAISFDSFTLPNVDDLQGLWDAMLADIAEGTAIPEAERHGTWFHNDVYGNDRSYILLALDTETDCFTYQVYSECENIMAWMAERNILDELSCTVVENDWDVSFEVVEADAGHLTLRCTRTSGHVCRLQMDSCNISGSFFMENPYLYDTPYIDLWGKDSAEVTIDWTESHGLLPAGDYELTFYLRNSPPMAIDWNERSVAFTIPE